MDYAKLTAILVEGVKEQQNQIQKQAKDIEALKQELIGSTAMLMESNKNLKANTKEIQDLKAEIVSLEGKVSGKQ
jgi:peptidoglycan hydrolase CwlO-like protein